MDVPNISRVEYTLLNIDDGFLNLIDQNGTAKDDVKVPEGEVGDQIQALFDDGKEVLVTVVSAMGEEHALSVKESPVSNLLLVFDFVATFEHFSLNLVVIGANFLFLVGQVNATQRSICVKATTSAYIKDVSLMQSHSVWLVPFSLHIYTFNPGPIIMHIT